VVVTTGGARAIRDLDSGEIMHPVVGPRIEAERGYLGPARLAERLTEPGPPLVLLDVGLGAGSLAIAAWHLNESLREGRALEILSFDRDREALTLALAHAPDFAFEGAAGDAARTLLRSGEHRTSRTTWRFLEGSLPATLPKAPVADVIFWDPFSPRQNPTLWTTAAFAGARAAARSGCTLHTYSGATATRAALLLAGFAVGLGAPIGEDKHGTIAATSPALLDRPLDRRWLERLGRSSAPLPTDAPADALAIIARAPQFSAG
jgi:queuine tRNA-ribosyltransferase